MDLSPFGTHELTSLVESADYWRTDIRRSTIWVHFSPSAQALIVPAANKRADFPNALAEQGVTFHSESSPTVLPGASLTADHFLQMFRVARAVYLYL